MKKALFAGVFALALAGAGYLGISAWHIGQPEGVSSLEGNISNGVYLAQVSGCIACHTAKGSTEILAGGHKLETDFGTFYSPNLTMSKVNGIGDWTISDFSKALRQGISPEGKPYYPAFPYDFYAKFSDQEIADLWAAFNTVPANEIPSKDHDLYFPFNIRDGLKLWRAAFLDFPKRENITAKSDEWNRGKYLVDGPLHCGACHTDRNLAGARKKSAYLSGASRLPDGGKSPSITSEALKANGWDKSSIIYALQSGILPDGDAFGGSMGEVVQFGTSNLTQEDLNAIAVYLLDMNS
ncbi:c-type cytochrome [Curvivirga sp.]|uniref:c-type cytochrome n=1 Tax=Curvivirga sp. TaxID=2856848 RepID=UPI003B5A8F52